MNSPISVFIPVKKSKLLHDFLPICLESIQRNIQHEIGEIVLVGDDIPSQSQAVSIINEKTANAKLELVPSISGWLRQQIFKLHADLFCTYEHILVVDADCCFFKPVEFFKDESSCFHLEDEYYKPYFESQKQLIGIDKVHKHSFIVDHMPMKAKRLQFLRQKVEDYTGKSFNPALLEVIQKGRDDLVEPFSEYELYGSMMLSYFQEEVQFFPKAFNHCRHFLLIEPSKWTFEQIHAVLSPQFNYLPALVRDSKAQGIAQSLEVKSIGEWHELLGYV